MSYPQPGEFVQSEPEPSSPSEIIPITPCPSEIMSTTISAIPSTTQLLSNTSLPLGVSLCPLAIPAERVTDANPNPLVPIVPYGGSTGIVRCRVCRTYINPYVEWLEGGRRWRCNLCGLVNDVPGAYYSPILAGTGQRKDLRKHPELTHGCVEFVAPSEYIARSPMPPSFVFVLDATYTAISSGFFEASVAAIRAWLAGTSSDDDAAAEVQGSIPRGSPRLNPRLKVAFFAYDGAVYAFSLRANSKTPRMLTVPDLAFASSGSGAPALPDDLFVTLADCREAVDTLLERLPAMFPAATAASPRHAGVAYGPALACAVNACKHAGGRVVSFLSAPPSLGPAGAALLPARDATLPGNTKARAEKEAQLAQPRGDAAGEYYKNMALDCSRCQITVDVIATSSSSRHIELATIGQLAQFTGGEVVYRANFNRARDGRSFERTIAGMLDRQIAWEAVMRMRCSKNIQITNHYGHMFVRSIDLLALPAPDMGKGYCTALRLTDPLPAPGAAYLQNALLYTSSSGERRIRVSTLRLPVVTEARQVFDSVNAPALLALLAKAAADKLSYTASLVDARDLVVRQLIRALAAYRRVAGPTAEPVAIPPSMAVVPLYVLGLLKHPALILGADDVRPDVRAAAIASLRFLPGEHMLVAMHPQMFNLNMIPDGNEDEDGVANVFPPPQTLSAASVDRSAIMLFNTGESIVLLVGRDVPQDTLMATFGTSSIHEAAALDGVPVVEGSPYNAAVRKIVDALVQARVDAGLSYPAVNITGDERILQVLLVDDHTRHFYSYQEFITQLQRNIEKELSN